jgi:hypothetical protein
MYSVASSVHIEDAIPHFFSLIHLPWLPLHPTLVLRLLALTPIANLRHFLIVLSHFRFNAIWLLYLYLSPLFVM